MAERSLNFSYSSSSSSSSSSTTTTTSSTKCIELFNQFDSDGDGKISTLELLVYMGQFGDDVDVKDAEALVASVDSDGDGLLGFDDFVKLVEEEEETTEEGLRMAFEVYVMEGVGRITAGSLRRTLGSIGCSRSFEDCREMISMFDLDGDGMLCFEEFVVMMKKMHW